MIMYKIYLFFKRFIVTFVSYKTGLALGILGSFVGLLQFTFMGTFLADGNSFPAIAKYGGNVLAYLIIGSAFQAFVGVSLNSFQSTIREEQHMGTLEFLLLSNTRLELVLVYSGIMNFIHAIVNVSILLIAVIFVFNVPLGVNLPASLLTVVLMISALSGIGLMSAGVIIITKVGDPITWAFTALTGLLSGVLFPVEYLPGWLQKISYLLPTTHALHALRLTLVQNADIAAIMPQVKLLVIMSCITLPLGLLIVRLGFNQARKAGSLAQY